METTEFWAMGMMQILRIARGPLKCAIVPQRAQAKRLQEIMEYRQFGGSGLRVPVLSFGTATYGGIGEFFKQWGTTQGGEARRLVDVCLDAGIDCFDTANVYSAGKAEEVLGSAIAGRRDKVLISTKGTFA